MSKIKCEDLNFELLDNADRIKKKAAVESGEG